MAKIDLVEMHKKRDLHLVTRKKHPTLDLYIWNYTPECQYSRAWDEYTIMARGLITDGEGNIVARPFRKFFNLNEAEETKIENLPGEIPEITEKIDGSLGIIVIFMGGLIASTRGSFESEQAAWAKKWIEKKIDVEGLLADKTYLMEICYKENRIVVDYGDREELVLLAIIDDETGKDLSYDLVEEEAKRLGVSHVKRVNKSIEDIVNYLEVMGANEEGFVALYSNGLRVKFKGKEYLRLHKILMHFSSKVIWEILARGETIVAYLEQVPDEFYQWAKEKEKELKDKYAEIYATIILGYNDVKDLPTRKEQALKIMKDYKAVSGGIFSLLDDKQKNLNDYIWKMIKPEYELPFKDVNREAE